MCFFAKKHFATNKIYLPKKKLKQTHKLVNKKLMLL